MSKYFYLTEQVILKRKKFLMPEEIEVGKIIGLPSDNKGNYIVQRHRTGEHLVISSENLVEEKVFLPWKMSKANERS